MRELRGRKDLWKGEVLGLDWKREGVRHSESGDDDGDDEVM